MCHVMPFSDSALKKNIFFDVGIVLKKTNRNLCGLSWSVLLPTTVCVINHFPNIFFVLFLYIMRVCNVPVNSKTTHPPPPNPRTIPGNLTFLKNVGQILPYVASLDGQMPHQLELQRGSNPPPSGENRIANLWT